MTELARPQSIVSAGSEAILAVFDRYRQEFAEITARAPLRFEAREWRGFQEDAARRLDVYRHAIDALEGGIGRVLGERVRDRSVWRDMKTEFASTVAARSDRELAETFFNSISRRIFSTVGVDDTTEFVSRDSPRPEVWETSEHRVMPGGDPGTVVETLLDAAGLGAGWQDQARDVALAAVRIAATIGEAPIDRVEVARHTFYRGMGAYIIGLLRVGDGVVPLVLAVHNGADGAWLDAVLLEERDVSILFSYTRSYFHVTVDNPAALVGFLRRIVPRKRIAELYIALGFDKHGKTELYRDLLDHLGATDERFEATPGTSGMVMAAFGLPSHDLVFKVIRDRFAAPKQTTRRAVMDRYRLVFRHDRAGRLIDAWEFEHLEFERSRFSDEVLDELSRTAGRTVEIFDEKVVVHHVYVERRVTPLDLFVRTRPFGVAARALGDMGSAVKDLARSGIFPGDMLLKNFGVTASGRVVFYDYDELSLLEQVRFRDLPQAEHPEDEMRAEPWFGVSENDVFPEEFRFFLGLPAPLHEAFLDMHADLFDPGVWRAIQSRVEEGEPIEIPPYAPERRLR